MVDDEAAADGDGTKQQRAAAAQRWDAMETSLKRFDPAITDRLGLNA